MRRKKMHNTIVAGKIYYFNYYIFAYTGVAHLEEINRNMTKNIKTRNIQYPHAAGGTVHSFPREAKRFSEEEIYIMVKFT